MLKAYCLNMAISQKNSPQKTFCVSVVAGFLFLLPKTCQKQKHWLEPTIWATECFMKLGDGILCWQAMLGFVWAVVAEKMTGLTVLEQLFSPASAGLVYFVGAIQLLTYASLVPIMNGESTDARSFGPFTATAERWNGRLAMIGFFALIVTELFTHSPVFH
jgi:hypothetical protein